MAASFAHTSYADQRIAQARQQVAANPKAFQTYNDLATSLCRKGRDTADLSLYKEAEAAIKRSLELSPNNYDGLKLRVAVLLGKHEYPQALKLAQELNKKIPDDIANWAFFETRTRPGESTPRRSAMRSGFWIYAVPTH